MRAPRIMPTVLRLSLSRGLSLGLALSCRLRMAASLACCRGLLPCSLQGCLDLMKPLCWAEVATAPQAVRARAKFTAAAHGLRGQPFFCRCLRRSLTRILDFGLALDCRPRVGCCRGLMPCGPPGVLVLWKPPFLQMPASQLRVERQPGTPQRSHPA